MLRRVARWICTMRRSPEWNQRFMPPPAPVAPRVPPLRVTGACHSPLPQSNASANANANAAAATASTSSSLLLRRSPTRLISIRHSLAASLNLANATKSSSVTPVPPPTTTTSAAGFFSNAKNDIDTDGEYTFIPDSGLISEVDAKEWYLLRPTDLRGLPFVSRHQSTLDGAAYRLYDEKVVKAYALTVWGSEEALDAERIKRNRVRPASLEEAKRQEESKSKRLARRLQMEQDVLTEQVDKWKGSTRAVTLAIASNVVVTVAKFGAWIATGSGSMFSEALHSLADVCNQALLAYGISSSLREPDKDHPYGYGPERYVWSLISGVGIFFVGCGVSVYHGITAIMHPHVVSSVALGLGVLLFSLAVETVPLIYAASDVRKSAKKLNMSFMEYVRAGPDPMAVAVLMEDGAAVSGVLVAGACIGLASVTGNPLYDALGSIAVGGLLGGVAVFIVQKNRYSLMGRSIHPGQMARILRILLHERIISSVHEIKATTLGADSIRFKAELQFNGAEVAARYHAQRRDMVEQLRTLQQAGTTAELEEYLKMHGDALIEFLGDEVDRLELNIQAEMPEVKYIELEIM